MLKLLFKKLFKRVKSDSDINDVAEDIVKMNQHQIDRLKYFRMKYSSSIDIEVV